LTYFINHSLKYTFSFFPPNNSQGNDVGTQYRSAIFFTNEAQHAAAEASKAKEQAKLSKPIATQILPEATWYNAEVSPYYL
jgi:peptide methionine sulfoxide reductase MsrA